MKVVNVIQRLTILRPFSSSSCKLPNLLTEKPEPLTQIIHILKNSDPIEPALNRVAHIVNPGIISSVMMNPPNTQLGFRFFIWAMKKKSFGTRKLSDLVIDMVLRENGGIELWWETLEELRRCGAKIPSDAFYVLISAYWKAGNAEKAVESFGKMRDFDCNPNVYAYNKILYVIMQKDLNLLALAVYNQMLKLNCSPNLATYSILIDGLCKSRKVEDALQLFGEMNERGLSPNDVTYTIVLSGLCHAGRVYDAQMLLDRMISNGCQPDWITCNAMLDGFCKVGRIDEAFILLKSFENQGYVLGINGYSCLIDGLFRAGRFEEANKWFRKLRGQNIVPDLVLYTIMIRGYSQVRRVKDALKFVQEMTDQGVVPDTQCYNTLIKGFCDIGLLDEAQCLKLEISKNNCFPDTCTYTILISGMCRNGLVGEAKEVFQEMEKLGCFPSVVTFNALINGLCKAGELEEARLLFYKMEIGNNPSLFLRLSQGTDRVLDSASLQNLVTRLCESGLYLKAYRLLTKLADNGVLPDTITYNILINGMCKSRDVNGAFKLFRELQVKGQSPDSITYGTLIDGLCRAHREEEAFSLVEEMMNKGCSPSSSVFKSLMTWSCRRRKVSVSFSLWLKYLRSLKNRDEEAIKLIEEHFERGELKEAVRGLLDMDLKLKDFDLGPYSIWIIGMCQVRRVEDALEIFHALHEFNVIVTPPSCVRLINALCSLSKLDLAADVFLYALGNGLLLKPAICNKLILSLLQSRPYAKLTFDLLSKMESVGYDLDAHLSRRTKLHLQDYINVQESAIGRQDTVVHQLASPG